MQNLTLNRNLHSKLPGNTCEERKKEKKDRKKVSAGYTTKNQPNHQPQGNIAGPSVQLIQMHNLMLNRNVHSKLPGNTCEERKKEKKDRK